MKTQYQGDFISHQNDHIVYLEGSSRIYIGSLESFEEWGIQQFRFVDKIDKLVYKQESLDYYKNKINHTDGRSYVYLDLNINTV